MNHYVIRDKYSIPGFLFVTVASWVASLMLATVALLVIAAIGGKSSIDVTKSLPWPLWVPLMLCGFYAAFGAFSLYLMMWTYWVAVERSSLWTRIVWLLILLVGLHYGALIYAIFVWKRDFRKIVGPQPLQETIVAT